ncbi:hypothetical protein OEA41_006571 [Lepraria neglecta]|uniref:Uncharacterized protein n=1 Tax=Lepraria neglecta TaxID=209136 RepID=A0AAD9ZBG4_9LECA|nr:hypothetical protein OEA41_006571 [Lepraria neglecta]
MTSVPILTVPQEIRDAIYDFVFEDLGSNITIDGSTQVPYGATWSRYSGNLPPKNAMNGFLALLHVNHQISTEVALSFYSGIAFRGGFRGLFIIIIRGFGSRQDLIRKMEFLYLQFWFPGYIGEFPCIHNTLEALPNSQIIKVIVEAQTSEEALAKPVDLCFSKLGRNVEIIVATGCSNRNGVDPLPTSKYVANRYATTPPRDVFLMWRRAKGESGFIALEVKAPTQEVSYRKQRKEEDSPQGEDSSFDQEESNPNSQ